MNICVLYLSLLICTPLLGSQHILDPIKRSNISCLISSNTQNAILEKLKYINKIEDEINSTLDKLLVRKKLYPSLVRILVNGNTDLKNRLQVMEALYKQQKLSHVFSFEVKAEVKVSYIKSSIRQNKIAQLQTKIIIQQTKQVRDKARRLSKESQSNPIFSQIGTQISEVSA